MAESPTRVVNVDGRRRRPWALSTREKILAAAVEEIAAVGLERARLSEIAKRANMTAGSVYTWFENKEDLFRAALENALSKLVDHVTENLSDTPLDTAAWLISVAPGLARPDSSEGPAISQMLLVEAYYAAWRDPAARKVLEAGIQRQFHMYRDVVDRAKASGHMVKDIDSDSLATLMLALPAGMSLVNAAGVPTVDSSAWISIFRRIAAAFAA